MKVIEACSKCNSSIRIDTRKDKKSDWMRWTQLHQHRFVEKQPTGFTQEKK